MSRKIRVLQVIQNLNYGGMERLLADIVLKCDADRFESHVLALGYLGRFAEGLQGHAELHLAPPMGRTSLLWPASLAEVIRCIAPDVVHMHSGIWYKASLAARQAGVPWLLFTEHGRPVVDRLIPRTLDRRAARRTNVVVAVSESVAARLRNGIVSPRTTLIVIENGVDTSRFAPAPDTGTIRRELGVPSDAPIIGSIGRLEHIKGYDIMIRAFAELLKVWHGPTPALVVGGDGLERDRCLALVRELSLPTVHLPGWRDDIHDLHSAFSLFTMSSRSEGTSVSLLEAMSAGLCPVVTDVGGNAAVLGEELRHRLVPSEDPAALAAGWRDALERPEIRKMDALLGRKRVEQRFSLRKMVQHYEELYLQGARS